MTLPIRILSTDFDGTVHADHENPPVPIDLQKLIGELQLKGMLWVINTGRDLSSLMESLGRAQLSIWPDFVVTVEREIHRRDESQFVPVQEWNDRCHDAHAELFARVRPDVPRLTRWIQARFHATIYEDPFSPFCLIAGNNPDAEKIHAYLNDYCRDVPPLTVVRNDVYARFSHADFNKGSALAEIARRARIPSDWIMAVGDHLNDLPMLSTSYARWLVAPANAIPEVKEAVRRQLGYISEHVCGYGVADGVRRVLNGWRQGSTGTKQPLPQQK